MTSEMDYLRDKILAWKESNGYPKTISDGETSCIYALEEYCECKFGIDGLMRSIENSVFEESIRCLKFVIVMLIELDEKEIQELEEILKKILFTFKETLYRIEDKLQII